MLWSILFWCILISSWILIYIIFCCQFVQIYIFSFSLLCLLGVEYCIRYWSLNHPVSVRTLYQADFILQVKVTLCMQNLFSMFLQFKCTLHRTEKNIYSMFFWLNFTHYSCRFCTLCSPRYSAHSIKSRFFTPCSNSSSGHSNEADFILHVPIGPVHTPYKADFILHVPLGSMHTPYKADFILHVPLVSMHTPYKADYMLHGHRSMRNSLKYFL